MACEGGGFRSRWKGFERFIDRRIANSKPVTQPPCEQFTLANNHWRASVIPAIY
jgi:hypothetical protein